MYHLPKTEGCFISNLPDSHYHLDGKEVEESFRKFNENLKKENEQKSLSPVVFGQTILPPFVVITNKGLTYCDNYKVLNFNKEANEYLLDNGKEKLVLTGKTFESIINPPKAKTQNPKTEEILQATDSFSIVKDKTIIPEFALITKNGLETFSEMKLEKYNANEKSYKLSNGENSITVTEDTFKELTSSTRFEKAYDENTPAYEKMLESQYNDYFKQRDNTAYNFRHNLSIYCRKEANSPLDAIHLAKEIVERMPKDERRKTHELLKRLNVMMKP